MSHNFIQGLAGFPGLSAVVVAQGHHGDDPYLRGNFQDGFYRLGIKGASQHVPNPSAQAWSIM